MRDAFGWSLDRFLYFGGYPGAASLVSDEERWERYILDALVETTLARDILLMTRVDKPALLRQLFELARAYSGQTSPTRRCWACSMMRGTPPPWPTTLTFWPEPEW